MKIKCSTCVSTVCAVRYGKPVNLSLNDCGPRINLCVDRQICGVRYMKSDFLLLNDCNVMDDFYVVDYRQ